ncbi:sensor histidine kinase [Vibrio rhizosphaerae]|uniref:sensor histidine kinase n=1 Tax=Vibrio rhizosphaerae TaxID=398736 RepID=UPI00056F8B96|nr:sensor histidine kinase [Vibrio rhizosphaerae]
MAYTSSSFKTRARTIDHLGREQIADCPTAISELWKNSYDAYATEVSLHLFDGNIDVAGLLDNGHGMNREEFENKWLTVGTESKTDGFEARPEDRNGLYPRPKQGQKGIGRLSSAALGPLLLLVSKRKDSRFVASLIDWRLFENPFIYLQDIRIPVTEFDHCYQLLEELPGMFDGLMGNIWGDSDDEARNQRLAEAWEMFSERELSVGVEADDTTKCRIENTLIEEVFTERHFNQWQVWRSEADHGTAMFVAGLQDALQALLSSTPLKEAEDYERSYRENFFQTLSNFTDPYSKKGEPATDNFDYSVTAWRGNLPDEILHKEKQFNIANLEDLEHIIEGSVDHEGYFKGRVKVFGEWVAEDYTVKPKQAYKTRKDTAFGPFHLRIGSYEDQIGNTSLPDDLHSMFKQQSELYSGLLVFRDGLRIMPYGRADSDYFRVEERRTKNAGMYFWSNRRMFGRVALTRESNPNLKDKAGREGFIDNKASKLFREIVENILIDVAKKHLGRYSETRKPTIEAIKEQKAQLKAEEDRKKLLSKERGRIRRSIKNNTSRLINHLQKLNELRQSAESRLSINTIDELQALKSEIDQLTEVTQSFSLSPIPPSLGRLEDDYRSYRRSELAAKEIIQQLTSAVNRAIAESQQKTDYEKATEIYRSKLASVNNSITKYATRGREMLSKQQTELDNLVKHCREQYKTVVENELEDLKLEKIPLSKVLTILDEEQEKVEIENAQKLSPYITALERINEEIDLEGLAIHSMNESTKYREELARLHSLAQLGVTVEIVGHELESLDLIIDSSLKSIAETQLNGEQKDYLKKANDAHLSLMEKLRFLSPLKLSGEKISKRISGQEIYNYVNDYFEEQFAKSDVVFSMTKSFASLFVHEYPSRIYPVFINLVNNALYWVQRTENEKRYITLDVNNNEIIVADNGPGVDSDDVEQLFTLFFTRKQRGGRGVGLYLSKQNLQAGGHKIRYETRENYKALPGANFAIEFKGVTHG